MAGKSGTAQVRRILAEERDASGKAIANDKLPWRLRDHALFVAYAPTDKPRYACAVVVDHGEEPNPALDLSGIAALRVKLDEIVIDATAGDGEWRATKLLSVRRHTPKDERPEMVAINFNFENIDCSWIGQRHIKQRRGYAAPCPECLLSG